MSALREVIDDNMAWRNGKDLAECHWVHKVAVAAKGKADITERNLK